MTPTIKTLTAVAALTLAAGGALAQSTQTVPLAQPDAAAVTAPESGTTFVVNPDGSRQTLTAEGEATDATTSDEPAAEEPAAAAEPAASDATEAPAETEAPTDEAAPAATETEAAEEPAADEAPAAETPASDAAEAAPEATEVIPASESVGDAAAAEVVHAQAEGADAEAASGSHEAHIEDVAFSFEGPFGAYDQHQLQRGLQVYTEVCAACHGLQYVPLRTLGDATGPGLPDDQVRAYAAELTKVDPETGDDVPREPSDNFPHIPHQDGMGPDLSLMAKARAGFHGPYGTGINQLLHGIGGPEYIHAILTGYTGESKVEAGATLYENTAFPGGWIAMPPPLEDERVTFQDDHPNDLDSLSMEVSAFLMWTAEPKMMQRKQVGTVAVLFLLLLSVLLYLTNKKLWSPIKHPRKDH